jgi:hypothetical protein
VSCWLPMAGGMQDNERPAMNDMVVDVPGLRAFLAPVWCWSPIAGDK